MSTIIDDGFENGSTTGWSTTDGTFSITTASALVGTYGAQADINGNNSVRKDSIGGKTRIRARFWFDPNSVATMNLFAGVRLLLARSSAFDYIFYVYVRKDSNGFNIQAGIDDDASAGHDGNFNLISDAPHQIDIDWRRATGAGANNGSIKLYIDSVLVDTVSGIDNDTWNVDRIDFGARDQFGVTGAANIHLDHVHLDDSDFVHNGENITVSESVSVSITNGVNVNDAVTVTESKSVALVHCITVNDAITVSESVSRTLLNNISVSENVTLAESFVTAYTKLVHEGKLSGVFAFLETSAGRSTVRASDGTLYTTFNAYTVATGFYEIYLAKSTDIGQTWVEKQITTSVAGSQFTPNLCIDSADNIYIIWEGYDAASNPSKKNIAIKKGTYANLDTQPRIEVTDNSVEQFVPSASIDADDNLHIVWYGLGYGTNTTIYQIVYRKYLSTGSFAAAALALTDEAIAQADPDITIDRNNNAHVVWYGYFNGDSTHAYIAYKKYDANTLSWGTTDSTLGNGVNGYGYPTIALDSNDKPYVAFWKNTNATYFVDRITGSWSSETVLVSTGSYSGRISIALDKSDNLYFAVEAPTGSLPPQMGIIRRINGVNTAAKAYTYKTTYQNKPDLMWSRHPMVHKQQMIPRLGTLGIWEDSVGTSSDASSGDIYFHKDINLAFDTDIYIRVIDTVTITESSTVQRFLNITLSDSVTVTESVSETMSVSINQSDAITVSESVNADRRYNVTLNVGSYNKDDFNRADNTSLGGNWTEVSADSQIKNNHMSNVTAVSSPSTATMLNTAPGFVPVSANYAVEAKVTAMNTAETIGIIGRYTDTTHFYMLRIQPAGSTELQLYVFNGTATKIGSFTMTITPTVQYTLRLEMFGSTIKGFIDGVERISVTDTALTAIGISGTRCFLDGGVATVSADDARYDDFTVWDMPTGEIITVTESVSLDFVNAISVSDAVTVAETVTATLGFTINVSDTVTITESRTIDDRLNITVSDAVSITESVTPGLVHGISTSDRVWMSESYDNGITFNGSTSVIDLGIPSVLQTLNSNFVLEFWVKTGTLSSFKRLFAARRTNSANGIGFGFNGTALRYTSFGVQDYDTTLVTMASNTVYHIILSVNSSSNATFFVNGVNIQTVNATGGAANNNTDDSYQLGATTLSLSSTLSEQFDGTIYKFRLYKGRTFTNQEATDRYNGIYTDETGLTARYYFSEGTGNISDTSGNGITGTVTAGTWTDGRFIPSYGHVNVLEQPIISDTVSVTESVSVQLVNGISVSDVITVTEGVTVRLGIDINKNDAITVTESVSTGSGTVDRLISVSDAVTVTESTTVRTILNISVNDAITVTDVVAIIPIRFTWSGYSWQRRDYGGGPAYNSQFSAGNVSNVDGSGYVTISISNPTGSSPYSAEFISDITGWGYGIYTCVVATRLDNIPKSAVFGGMFTYDSGVPVTANEIDVCEASAWGESADPVILSHVYWKDVLGVNTSVADSINATADVITTHRLIWTPSSLVFDSYIGSGTGGTLLFHTEQTSNIPVPANERVLFNAWVFGGGDSTPSTVPQTDFILRSFTYSQLLNINVSDAVTVTESVTARPVISISVNDVVSVTESVTLRDTLNLSVSDAVTVVDSASMFLSNNGANVIETVTVSESVAVTMTQLGGITVNDVVTIAETVGATTGDFNINVSDSITITESKTAVLAYAIVVSDSVAVAESVSLVQNLGINVNDSVSVSESVSGSIVLQFTKNDTITVTDAVTVTLVHNISTSDTITVSESVALFFLVIITLETPLASRDNGFPRAGQEDSLNIPQSSASFGTLSGSGFDSLPTSRQYH